MNFLELDKKNNLIIKKNLMKKYKNKKKQALLPAVTLTELQLFTFKGLIKK